MNRFSRYAVGLSLLLWISAGCSGSVSDTLDSLGAPPEGNGASGGANDPETGGGGSNFTPSPTEFEPAEPRGPCDPIRGRIWALTPFQIANTLDALLPEAVRSRPERNDGVVQTDFFGEPRLVFDSAITPALSPFTTLGRPFTSDPNLQNAGPGFVKALYETVLEQAGSVQEAEYMPECIDDRDSDCISEIIEQVAGRAFRRPLREDEREVLIAFYDEQLSRAGAQEAMNLLLRRIQLSPAVYFRTEVGESGNGGALTPYEVADFIAYSVSDGPPDVSLRAAANDGSILNAETARHHVERLVQQEPALNTVTAGKATDPKTARGLMRFYREWLDMDAIRREERGYLRDVIISNLDDPKGSRVPADRVQRRSLRDCCRPPAVAA
ncbi:MAG: DUF1595 domain-containing protein, partial [Myxococcota bacterium]